MKLRICLKDPNGVDHSVAAIAEAIAGDTPSPDCAQGAIEYVKAAIHPWIHYGEYVTIEIDTEAGTAVVVPVKT